MAWISPVTFVANTALTAAQLNMFIRDNLNLTAPAKATGTSQWFVSTASNSIEARNISGDTHSAGGSITSTSYTETAGNNCTVTVATGKGAIVALFGELSSSVTGDTLSINYAVTGASNVTPADQSEAIYTHPATHAAERFGTISWVDLTPGSNTFSMKIKVGSGSGSIVNGTLLVVAV